MEQIDNQNQELQEGTNSQNVSPQAKRKEDQKSNQKEKVISSLEFERTKQRYEESEKILEKLKQQNQKLKSQLEELQTQLPQILENVREKSKDKTKVVVKEKNPLEIELNQKHQKIVQLQKDIAGIKSKLESNKNTQKIVDLENQMKLLDNEIEIEEKKKNTLQKIKNDHEKQINMIESQREYQAKIIKLKEESKQLRDKIRQLEKQELEDTRKAKEQTGKLVILQQRYREACKSLGISASINFTKAEEINQNLGVIQQPKIITGADRVAMEKRKKQVAEEKAKPIVKKIIQRKQIEEDEEDKRPIEVSEQYYKELKARIREIKSEYKESIRKHENELIVYQSKIKEMELERKDLQNREKEKESVNIIEARISLAKFNEYKRLTKQTSHLDYELIDKSLSFRNLQPVQQKEDKSKNYMRALLDTRRRKTKRDYIGIPSLNQILFDDLDFVGYNSNQRLSQLTIFHSSDQMRIFGIQATYAIPLKSKTIVGGKCMHYGCGEVASSVLRIQEGDRLRFISGFAKERIVYLKLETQNQDQITVGQVSGNKLEEFHLELSKDDIPVLIFAGLDQTKQPKDFYDYQLVLFGLELKRDLNKEEIEENINEEEESKIINARRGLFQSRIKPIRNQSSGQYNNY